VFINEWKRKEKKRKPSHSQVPLTVYLPTTPRQRVVGVAGAATAKMMSSVTDWECSFMVFG
jgi:hypothetical protein